jgi:hypothetical protein
MKQIGKIKFFWILLVFSLNVASQRAIANHEEFSLKNSDHQLHMLSTYGLSLTFTELLQSRKVTKWKAVFLSSLATMALGYGKEKLVDSEYNDADMIANSVGVLTQAVVVFTFDL